MSMFSEIESFFTSKCKEVKLFLSLLKLEAKLAGLSVFPLLLNLSLLFVVLITVWITAMLLIGYAVVSLYHNMWWAISSVLGLDLILCAVLIKCVLFHLKNLSFVNTRQYLNDSESDENEQTTQETSLTNTNGKRRAGLSASSSESE